MEDLPPESSGGVTEMEKTVSSEQLKEEPAVILDDDPGIGGSGDGGGDVSLHSTVPVPKPMEGLRELGPPPFLKKIYEMVEDPETTQTISWNLTGKSFVIYDHHSFSGNLLPKYFKHSNFSSFVRQLNTYGFKKIDPDRWEFANEGFLKGNKDLLKTIKRKKHSSQTTHQQGSGRRWFDQTISETEAAIEALRHDRREIRTEIKKLKEQQESAEFHLATVRDRIVSAETKQQQLIVFVSKAFTSPAFLGRFVQFLRQKKELGDGHVAKKPRLVAKGKSSSSVGDAQNQEELTMVEDEVETLFSDSLEEDDSHIPKDGDDATPPGLGVPDLCSENYVLWEKLLADEMIIGHEESPAQDPSVIVQELKSLMGDGSMGGRGKDMVEQVG